MELDLGNNQIASPGEVRRLQGLGCLLRLTLTGNPVELHPAYRFEVLYTFWAAQGLDFMLDGAPTNNAEAQILQLAETNGVEFVSRFLASETPERPIINRISSIMGSPGGDRIRSMLRGDSSTTPAASAPATPQPSAPAPSARVTPSPSRAVAVTVKSHRKSKRRVVKLGAEAGSLLAAKSPPVPTTFQASPEKVKEFRERVEALKKEGGDAWLLTFSELQGFGHDDTNPQEGHEAPYDYQSGEEDDAARTVPEEPVPAASAELEPAAVPEEPVPAALGSEVAPEPPAVDSTLHATEEGLPEFAVNVRNARTGKEHSRLLRVTQTMLEERDAADGEVHVAVELSRALSAWSSGTVDVQLEFAESVAVAGRPLRLRYVVATSDDAAALVSLVQPFCGDNIRRLRAALICLQCSGDFDRPDVLSGRLNANIENDEERVACPECESQMVVEKGASAVVEEAEMAEVPSAEPSVEPVSEPEARAESERAAKGKDPVAEPAVPVVDEPDAAIEHAEKKEKELKTQAGPVKALAQGERARSGSAADDKPSAALSVFLQLKVLDSGDDAILVHASNLRYVPHRAGPQDELENASLVVTKKSVVVAVERQRSDGDEGDNEDAFIVMKSLPSSDLHCLVCGYEFQLFQLYFEGSSGSGGPLTFVTGEESRTARLISRFALATGVDIANGHDETLRNITTALLGGNQEEKVTSYYMAKAHVPEEAAVGWSMRALTMGLLGSDDKVADGEGGGESEKVKKPLHQVQRSLVLTNKRLVLAKENYSSWPSADVLPSGGVFAAQPKVPQFDPDFASQPVRSFVRLELVGRHGLNVVFDAGIDPWQLEMTDADERRKLVLRLSEVFYDVFHAPLETTSSAQSAARSRSNTASLKEQSERFASIKRRRGSYFGRMGSFAA